LSRRRWVYREVAPGQVEAFEVGADVEPEARTQIVMDRHYENTCATDGTDIGSRRKHREYMRINGLTTMDDYKDTWAKAEKERQKFYAGDFDHKARREAIGRAMYEAERKRKK
jgi:hypothetical protein